MTGSFVLYDGEGRSVPFFPTLGKLDEAWNALNDPFGENIAMLDKPKALTLTEDFRTVAPETEDGEVTYKNADVKAHSGSGSDARLL